MVGYNSRLDALQAAILRVQLPFLDGWSDGRRAGAAHYADAGLGELVQLPVATPGAAPAWHLYVVQTPDPDSLAAALTERGIGARVYYRVPTHQQAGMRPYAPGAPLPGTDAAALRHLALPISPVLGASQAAEVVDAARAHLSAVVAR